MVVEQPAAGHHESGRVVVELAQAVGGFGDQESVVAAVPGDGPESFERLHSAQPTGRRPQSCPGESRKGESSRPRTGASARSSAARRSAWVASSSGRPRTFSAPRANASWARSAPWCSAHAVAGSVTQHDVGRRSRPRQAGHRRAVGAEAHLVAGVAVGAVHEGLDREGRVGTRGRRRRVAAASNGRSRRRRGIRPRARMLPTGACSGGRRGVCPRAPTSLGSRPGELSCARDRGRRAREALRHHVRGGRDLLLDRDRRGVRPARAERRGQDHHGRDPRGLPPRRRRRGARARRRPVARRGRAAAAHRRDAAGGRAVSRGEAAGGAPAVRLLLRRPRRPGAAAAPRRARGLAAARWSGGCRADSSSACRSRSR